MGICMDCKKRNCDCMQNHWDLVNKGKEKNINPIQEIVITTIEEGNISYVRMEDYLEVEKENKKLQKEYDKVKKDNENWKKEHRSLQNICNSRGKEIKKNKEDAERFYYEVYKKEKEEKNRKIKELEKEIVGMKNVIRVKCCQECAKFNYQQYLKDKNLQNKNTMEEYVLKEDCEICNSEGMKTEGKLQLSSMYGKFGNDEEKFVDSWVLWYKVEGMNEAVQQFHLTKEECEIIYGNLTNLTYWHMEVMK